MRKSLSSLALALLTVALAAGVAGAVPGPNSIGVYCDVNASSNWCTGVPSGAMLNWYLIATGVTESSGLSGWEAHVYFDPMPMAGVSYTYGGTGAVNPLTAPDFQVGLGGGPIAQAPAMVVLTMGTFYLGGELLIGVGPITTAPTSFPDTNTPGYAAGNAPEVLIPLWPSSDQQPIEGVDHAYWVCGINTPSPINDVTDTSWGSVKALYQ